MKKYEDFGSGRRLKSFVPSMVLDAHDREVIEACRRGDHQAFAVLFETYRDRVYSIALRYSGDSAAAMDITQDTFVKLMLRIGDFRGEASFDSWLYRLVVNRCLDHRRRKRNALPFLDGFLDVLRASGESVLQRLLRAETELSVQKIVGGLPPDQRMVIVLRYTEGLTYDQIAEILNCSSGTVASRLNRAHRTLGRRLAHLQSAAKREEDGTGGNGHA